MGSRVPFDIEEGAEAGIGCGIFAFLMIPTFVLFGLGIGLGYKMFLWIIGGW